MKKFILLPLSIFIVSAYGQINSIYIDHATYVTKKANHQLDVTKNYLFTDAVAPTGPPKKYQNTGQRSPSSICSCMIPLDTTFIEVPMMSYGGANSTVYQDNRNDDASSTPITIPFTFNFYGATYSQLFINNNGNISFQQPWSQYNAQMFPLFNYYMIAPFWGDVDTRDFTGNPSCLVYYKMNPHSMIVKWENVGYYDMHFDKLNTFQLIISDGLDSILPAGKNVGFCYGDMQWTTGDASGGSAGYAGVPATVGVNQGNGVDYFQVGTFNYPGTYFDGPYNAPDAIDWLDNQGMYFNVVGSGINIAPIIINNNICDTIDVYTGDTTRVMLMDTVQFAIGSSTPEISQTVSTTFSTNDTLAFSYDTLMNTPTYQKFMCRFVATNLPTGLHYIYVTATDNGTPALSTTDTIVIRSNYHADVTTTTNDLYEASELVVYPNPTEGMFTVSSTKYKIQSINLTDVLGETVYHSEINNQKSEIDLTGFAKGIYFATITGKDGNNKTIKVVKQ